MQNNVKLVLNSIYFLFSLPWNQQTIVGYIFEIFADIFFAEGYLFSNGILLLMFISICLHHKAFHDMLRISARKLDGHDKDKKNKAICCNLVCFHVQVKR